MNMLRIKILTFALTFYGLVVDLEAVCPKGHRVKMGGRKGLCEVCPAGFYQPTENDSLRCMPCTKCEEDRGSEVTRVCTKETDAECRCRVGFVHWANDSSICKCDIGFGLKNGVCSKCEDGSFSNRINSPCKKWTECKSGVNTSGTRTKDVICNEITSNITNLSTPQQPQEETPSQTIYTTTSSTISASTGTTKGKGHADPPTGSNTGNWIGGVLLILGIVGLLLLTTVTCKLHITPDVQRKPAEQKNDSMCRRPVEESGDDSELSVKLNAGES